MIGIIQVPVCVTEKVVKQAVIPQTMSVQNIRLILLHWQKAMGRKASVLQKQKR